MGLYFSGFGYVSDLSETSKLPKRDRSRVAPSQAGKKRC